MKVNPENWASAEKLFHELVDLPKERREEELNTLKTKNHEVFELLSLLLKEEENPHPLLSQTSSDILNKLKTDEDLIGSRIGAFKLDRLIGQGAMGSVFLASRADGQFTQIVAIKLIKHANYIEENIKLFLNERQVLADLHHPNIAHLYDGGISDDGRPYFVMEYIDGVSIIDYCKQFNLNLKERLKLFCQLCEVIGFAHQSLIVHLDLKPDNILVDKSGKVKVLDFGISRLLTHYSKNEQLQKSNVGSNRYTLAYASPEQLKKEPVSTSTDIYALGTLFYQIISYIHPFQAYLQDIEKLHLAIINQDPQPVTRARYHDLNLICNKALQKEPADRYPSVSILEQDIRAFLNHFPIYLKRNHGTYVVGRYIKRNVRLVTAISIAVLILLSTIGYFTVRVTRERNQAIKEATRSTEILGLLTDVFQSADPNEANGDTITAVQLLDRGLEKLEENLKNQPELQASMLQQLGIIYLHLGQYQKADSLVNTAFSINEELFSPPHQALAENLVNLSAVMNLLGNIEKSIEFSSDGYHMYRELGFDETKQIAEALHELSNAHYLNGDFIKSDSVYRMVYAINQKLYKPPHTELANDLHNLGTGLRKLSRYDEAEEYLLKSLEMKKQLYKEPHAEIAFTLNHLGSLFQNKGDWEGSIPFIEQSLEQRKKIFGTSHIETIASQSNLARAYRKTNRLDEAAEIYEDGIIKLKATFGNEHYYVAGLVQSLAGLYLEQGKLEKADSMFTYAIGLEEKILDENDVKRTQSFMNLADLKMRQGYYHEALELLKKSLSIRELMYPDDHEALGINYFELGKCLVALGEGEKALKSLEQALRILNQYSEKYPNMSKDILQLLVETSEKVGTDEKAKFYRDTLSVLTSQSKIK